MLISARLLAYLPSPSSNGIQIGPLHLRAYGLMIALAIFAAVWLADRRWRARGGEPGTVAGLAMWAVPGGLIGARLYHLATDYELYTNHPLNMFKIWQGGLGIWGGIAGGVAGGAIYLHRHHLSLRDMMDVVAPALPLAQAIGRWGNWFNQELYGRPTTLPWGLRIDAAHRPAAYPNAHTFQPTFLYESIWDLMVVAVVLFVEKRVRLRRGYLFAVYVSTYTFGRFFTEYLRIDFAHKFLGLRLNDWTSILVFAVSTTLLLVWGRAPADGEQATTGADEQAGPPDQDGPPADQEVIGAGVEPVTGTTRGEDGDAQTTTSPG
ncbi:MAG TPA: prolipoprotein diacylglyceryl transferase [Acidimicrobiales bacterium]